MLNPFTYLHLYSLTCQASSYVARASQTSGRDANDFNLRHELYNTSKLNALELRHHHAPSNPRAYSPTN